MCRMVGRIFFFFFLVGAAFMWLKNDTPSMYACVVS